MRALRKTQAAVPRRGILERDPKPHRARRIGVQEGAVLMRGHAAADLGLLADDHALEHARVAEPERARDGCVRGGQRHRAEGRGESVQVVADFVDGQVCGLREGAGRRGEGAFFEEKSDFVVAC